MNFQRFLIKIALALATVSAFSPHPSVPYYRSRSLVQQQSSHQDLYDAEEEAAFDAHDLSDAGMEAAAMERAVMMANDAKLRKKKMSTTNKDDHTTKESSSTEASGPSLVGDHQSLYEAEEEAAFDAHDLSDAGMEAAAMERAVMMANDAKLRKKKTSTTNKDDHTTKETISTEASGPSLVGDHQSLYEAEEEAAFDAHDLSDAGMEAAAMERAVMIANNLLRKKRKELKDKTENAKKVEKEYVLVKQATNDLAKLFKSYEADPSRFRKEFASRGKDESSLAIEMLEKVIAETSEEMLELQREENYIIANFLDALHKEEMAEAISARLEFQEEAERANLNSVEEFDGDYEVNERKRDMSSFHFMKEKEQFERSLKDKALDDENKFLTEEFERKKHLEELQQKEKDLKADLRSIQEIVREQLRQEWSTRTEGNTHKD